MEKLNLLTLICMTREGTFIRHIERVSLGNPTDLEGLSLHTNQKNGIIDIKVY